MNYVDVDVVVTDEQGNFVTGLTRDDFEVFEDGKPQKIDTFSIVEIPVEKPAGVRLEGRTVAADTQTNRKPFDGRVYVIVLDDLDVSAMRSTPVKDAARKFVREYMGANDLGRGRLYERPERRRAGIHDRSRAARRVHRQVHRAPHAIAQPRAARRVLPDHRLWLHLENNADPSTGTINSQDQAGYGRASDPTELERGTRALSVLDTLKNTAEFLGSVRGRRKAAAVLQRRARLSRFATCSARTMRRPSFARRRTPSPWRRAPT